MKNIILIQFATLFAISCTAQTVPLFNGPKPSIEGAYYKDLDNDLNDFAGTWEYVNGTTSFKIILEKKEHFYNDFTNCYEDMVVGEYKYIQNGVEKINTLPQLSPTPTNLFDCNITGNSILKKTTAPVCDDCTTNERRLALAFKDPNRPGLMDGLSGEVILRRVDVGSVQKIEVWLRMRSPYRPPAGTNPGPEQFSFNVPWGTYTLTKIN